MVPRVEQRVEVGRKRGDGETSWVCFGRIAHISGQPSAAGDDDTSGGFGHAELASHDHRVAAKQRGVEPPLQGEGSSTCQ